MPRAEVGTPKFVANKMKSKGLQRLRWYCQVCEKQCRDENGFKCHAASESHLRQMLVVGEHAGSHIAGFSSQFQSEFVAVLSRRFGTKRVLANRVYQEYISDKAHLHMNATRWVTLSEFVKHLGRTGVARVDETEKGWFIAWIDNSPQALSKQEASMKKERLTVSDEQRERQLIAEQIEKAAAEKSADAEGQSAPDDVDRELKREEGAEKVVLSFAKPAAPVASSPSSSAPVGLKMNPLKGGNAFKAANPLKANPLKRPNVFKQASSTPSQGSLHDKKRPMSAAEALIMEEQERKKRRMDRDNRA
ncbi:zinc finger protein RTS2 [Ephemerocybe angulata]|uniref:Zinc finger protein RTS2 n=1 Tax=Ephemerocybe angulata TaxID=980116 RepID=A0A8H6HK69_9AGAR|nr:zinc finger protein RTS2 [Tulosesus angulatus]